MKQDEETPSGQSLSVEGESHVRASEAGPPTQKTHPCEICIPVFKGILHQAEDATIYPLQKPYLGVPRVRCFCFAADLHQQQKHDSGEKPWKRDVDRASFVRSCSFFMSGKLFTCRRSERTSRPPQAFSSARPFPTVRSHRVAVRVGRPFTVKRVFTGRVNVN